MANHRIGDKPLTNNELQARFRKKQRVNGSIRLTGYLNDPELIELFETFQKKSGISGVKPATEEIIRLYLESM